MQGAIVQSAVFVCTYSQAGSELGQQREKRCAHINPGRSVGILCQLIFGAGVKAECLVLSAIHRRMPGLLPASQSACAQHRMRVLQQSERAAPPWLIAHACRRGGVIVNAIYIASMHARARAACRLATYMHAAARRANEEGRNERRGVEH